MSDLATWLHAQLDDDERVARACVEEIGGHRAGEPYDDGSGIAETDAFPSYPWGSQARELAYMAGPGHPARVLADVDAKRRMLDLHKAVEAHEVGDWLAEDLVCEGETDGEAPDWVDFPCTTVRLLALPYADRDGYRDEWRPA